MLTDGTEGVCLLNGVCAASFLLGEDTTEKPYCTHPYSKEGCERWCMCTTPKKNPGNFCGTAHVAEIHQCVEECKSQFAPN